MISEQDLYLEFEQDAKLDQARLDDEALAVPALLAKYLKYYGDINAELRKRRRSYAKLRHYKFQWYGGRMSQDDLKKLGWQPYQHKLLRGDIPEFVDNDADVVAMKDMVDEAESRIEMVRMILDSIKQRTWLIKNAIEWTRFTTGG